MGLWAAKLARSGPDVMGCLSRLDLGSPIEVLGEDQERLLICFWVLVNIFV